MPMHVGRRLKANVPHSFMSGGAGYVLSKAAERRFVEQTLSDPLNCKPGEIGMDDIELG